MLLKNRLNECGFTLLEVLVAMTIAGSVFVILLNAFGTSMRSTGIAEGYTTASYLAKEVLVLLESKKKPSPGKEKGDFGEDYPAYTWKIETNKDPTLPFYIAKVSVFFVRQGIEREIQLETVLLDTHEQSPGT